MALRSLQRLFDRSRESVPEARGCGRAEINQLDLAFIIDTTGSMSGLIEAVCRLQSRGLLLPAPAPALQ